MTEGDYILLIIVLSVWAGRETVHVWWGRFKRRARDEFHHAMIDLIDADKRAVHRRRK